MSEAVEIVAEPQSLPEPGTPLAIEIEDMHKSYGRMHAVNGLTMHVPRGSVYGFVGPNGAGKTSTIRTLATLQKPDRGIVHLAGLDVIRQPGQVRDLVGYMPDFFGVYDSLTVREYLHFYGASHRIPSGRRHQICDELLELVDLTDKRDEQVGVLSRGMKQRLGLARCLIHDPEVLLLDEPASGMDPRARIELREILRELCRLDKTILISSHILPELAEMCTHVGIIRAGSLIAEGPVDEVISALSPSVTLRVKLLRAHDVPAVLHLLEAHPCCAEVEEVDARAIEATWTGDEDDLAALLGTLVARSIPVVGFDQDGGTLEDIFLHITELSEVED